MYNKGFKGNLSLKPDTEVSRSTNHISEKSNLTKVKYINHFPETGINTTFRGNEFYDSLNFYNGNYNKYISEFTFLKEAN